MLSVENLEISHFSSKFFVCERQNSNGLRKLRHLIKHFLNQIVIIPEFIDASDTLTKRHCILLWLCRSGLFLKSNFVLYSSCFDTIVIVAHFQSGVTLCNVCLVCILALCLLCAEWIDHRDALFYCKNTYLKNRVLP